MLASNWLGKISVLFIGSPVGVHMGMPIGTLRGSALVIGFYCGVLSFGFLPGSFLGVSFGLPP